MDIDLLLSDFLRKLESLSRTSTVAQALDDLVSFCAMDGGHRLKEQQRQPTELPTLGHACHRAAVRGRSSTSA
ncbi:hypothetical protein ABIC63_005782 [Pseudacidovorax sp. 1753]|uniref:hypothetical protein n=1 Tax=Pseudacidovorax sp. 1753 TaxID=3156419 RepID=UPI00339A33F2